MRRFSPDGSKTHGDHRAAHWVAVVFAIAALVGLFLILVIGAEDLANDDQSSPAQPQTEAGFQCERGEPSGFELTDVEGRQLDEVEEWADAQGQTVREVVRDGESLAVTADFNQERINVQVEGDLVTRYCGNG